MTNYLDILKKHWLVACRTNEVKNKPYKVVLLNTAIVIVRINGQINAFLDICPHRNAPLSRGRVINDRLECPYHGWQFDKNGICHKIPGLCDFSNHHSYNLKPLQIFEDQNFIWIKIDHIVQDSTPPYRSDYYLSNKYYSYNLTTHVETSLEYALENFLDGTHTHFVHNKLIRGKNYRKQITAQIYGFENKIEIHYINEGKQSGIISKLFEQERNLSIAKFITPNIAELEYHSDKGINMVITVYFTHVKDGLIKAFILITFKKTFVPSKLKEIILNPFLKLAIYQDKKILKLQNDNIDLMVKESFINTKIDLIRPYILKFFKGEKLADQKHFLEEIVIDL